MKKIFILMMLMFCTIGFAQQVTVDLSKLGPDARNAVIETNKKANEPAESVNTAKEWAGVAQGIGESVKELCKSLNVEVNSFIQTPAGKLLVFVLLWKLLFANLIASLMFILVAIACVISWKHFHWNQDYTNAKGVEIKRAYRWRSEDAKIWSVIFHVGIFLLSLLIAGIIL